jgi:hypothetical protein
MMPSDFVPFLKSAVKPGASSSPCLPASPSHPARDNAAAAAGFAALMPGASAPATAPDHAKSKPVVTLSRDGDVVTHIHIQCACGEVVELECAY